MSDNNSVVNIAAYVHSDCEEYDDVDVEETETWTETFRLTYLMILKTMGLQIKGTVMQIEKALKNDRLCVLKVSWKFCIPAIYYFAIIYLWNLLFS